MLKDKLDAQNAEDSLAIQQMFDYLKLQAKQQERDKHLLVKVKG